MDTRRVDGVHARGRPLFARGREGCPAARIYEGRVGYYTFMAERGRGLHNGGRDINNPEVPQGIHKVSNRAPGEGNRRLTRASGRRRRQKQKLLTEVFL